MTTNVNTTARIHTNDADAAVTNPDSLGSVVWHTFNGNAHEPNDVLAALAAEGFDKTWGVTAMTPLMVMSEAINRGKATYSVNGGAAEHVIVTLPLSKDKDEATFGMHVSRKGASKRAARIGQIASLTFDRSNNAVDFAFLDAPRLAGESRTDYASRVAAMGTTWTPEDTAKASSIAKRITNEVATRGGKVDSVRMTDLLRAALTRPEMRAMRLRPSGGVYFVPNVADVADAGKPGGEANNPVIKLAALAKVCEGLATGNSVYVLPQYDNAGTKRAVAASAEDTLFGNLKAVEDALADATKLRASTLATKAAEVKDTLDTARLYERMLGVAMTGLMDKIAAVQANVEAAKAELKAGTGTTKAPATKADKAEALAAKADALADERMLAMLVGMGHTPEAAAKLLADAKAKQAVVAPTVAPVPEPEVAPTFTIPAPSAIRDLAKAAKAANGTAQAMPIGGGVVLTVATENGAQYAWAATAADGGTLADFTAKSANALVVDVIGVLSEISPLM